MAWLPGWNRRKSKIVNGSTAGAQTNYQLRLTVYKGPGADTDTTVYFGGNSRSNFGDIRFTRSDGETLLDYWIESYTYGDNAVIWVEIDSIPASPGAASIYIYYDNIDVNSIDSGMNTFLIFDDFADGDYTNNPTWTNEGGTWDASPYYLKRTIKDAAISVPLTTQYVHIHKIWRQVANSIGNTNKLIMIDVNNYYYFNYNNTILYIGKVVGGTTTFLATAAWSPTAGTWYNWDMYRDQNGLMTLKIDGVTKVTATDTSLTGTPTKFYIYDNVQTAGWTYIETDYDDFRIRKYISPEPTFGPSGTEESEAFLYAESIPPGALIIVDAIDTGVLTPGTVTVTPGTRTVVLRLEGYDDSTSIINFTPQETETLIVQLRTSGSTTPIGSLYIESTPSGARIYIDDIDKGVLTNSTFTGITTGSHTYRLVKSGYQDATGPFTILEDQTTTVSETLIPYPICLVGLKYEGDTVHLSAIPRDGTGPYYVEFRKNLVVLAQYYDQSEDVEKTYDYVLTNEDIRTASGGTIQFSVYMEDSCPTGSQTCIQICTVNIGCYTPVCNFQVT